MEASRGASVEGPTGRVASLAVGFAATGDVVMLASRKTNTPLGCDSPRRSGEGLARPEASSGPDDGVLD